MKLILIKTLGILIKLKLKWRLHVGIIKTNARADSKGI